MNEFKNLLDKGWESDEFGPTNYITLNRENEKFIISLDVYDNDNQKIYSYYYEKENFSLIVQSLSFNEENFFDMDNFFDKIAELYLTNSKKFLSFKMQLVKRGFILEKNADNTYEIFHPILSNLKYVFSKPESSDYIENQRMSLRSQDTILSFDQFIKMIEEDKIKTISKL